jgi:hypothetical protein
MSEVKSESKLENELLVAAGSLFKTKKHDTRQEYLHRLCNVIATKISDDAWGGLSQEAQDWNNDAAEALTKGEEVVDFPDFSELESEVEEEAVEEAPAPKVKKRVAAKAKVEKAPKEEESEEEAELEPEVKQVKPKKTKAVVRSSRKAGACYMIKKFIVQQPNISVLDLSGKLLEDGIKVSDITIATLRSSTRETLRVLNELELGNFEM